MCRIKILNAGSFENNVAVARLPGGMSFAHTGTVIALHKSSGEWGTPSTIVYGYIYDNAVLGHKSDLTVGSFVTIDYIARIN